LVETLGVTKEDIDFVNKAVEIKKKGYHNSDLHKFLKLPNFFYERAWY